MTWSSGTRPLLVAMLTAAGVFAVYVVYRLLKD
jgi:hypothetical protein